MSSNKPVTQLNSQAKTKPSRVKPFVLSYQALNRQVRQVSAEHRCFVPGYN